ncbi:DUF3034 family protein [Sphingomonas abaci]|uniref:DUF3034 family protein n=1 Tax=Sphingomonas abaci TaxID=237611 RepID=A0A7W7AH51_9SPHN|nr:DUF3034 family protein [Sphingomonas abaci]MBB4615957.1 hypothetical protein [Sphingomonas abaci]
MRRLLSLFGLSLLAHAMPADASERRWGGKLRLTDGVSSVEGAAGGGLASWAVIAGSETRDGIGGSAHATLVALPDFDLKTAGISLGLNDRVELSYAYQRFDTRRAGAALGLGRGFTFGQHIVSGKVRLVGDAVWDQDRWLPQIAIGVQHKVADQGAVIRQIGGRSASGTDLYASATKVVLAQSLVVDATMRWTKANQFGLLGFGGDRRRGRSLQFEGSAGLLVTPSLLLGAEWRTKPDNLAFAREQRALDAFAAWAVARHLTVTAAYVDLGDIATFRRQRGAYLSLRGNF